MSVRLKQLLKIDRAIVYSMVSTIRGGIGGPLVALSIALKFSPNVQGYYYTFGTILALQVFAEMGLGAVIVQFAAHEWAGLNRNVDGSVSGDSGHLSRLASIARFGLRWYTRSALALGLGLLVAGTLFLGSRPSEGINWLAPWCALVLVATARFSISPLFSLLEGCGELPSVYGYRLWEGTQMVIVTCVSVLAGAGLWTAPIVTFASLVSALFFQYRWHGKFFRALFQNRGSLHVSWRQELLPLQWRIALSWITGYFAFQLFVPVAFHYQGPAVAGRVGLTLSLVSTISSTASAWISTKVPIFGTLIARRRWNDLDALALHSGLAASAVALAGSIAALIGLEILRVFQPALASRFMDPISVLPFLGATVILQITFVQASYLRGFKREPLLWPSVGGGILIGLLTWVLGARFGPIGMGIGYLSVMAFLTLPIFTFIFLRLRVRWRLAATVDVV